MESPKHHLVQHLEHRRAQSILEVTQRTDLTKKGQPMIQSHIKTRQEIEAKIKDKRNMEALQGASL